MLYQSWAYASSPCDVYLPILLLPVPWDERAQASLLAQEEEWPDPADVL